MYETVHIAQGKKRPDGWLWRQRWQMRRGLCQIIEPHLSPNVPAGTSIKICGLASMHPFRWRRWAVQRPRSMRDALTVAFSVAWEDSDRIIGIVATHDVVTEDGAEKVRGLALRAYAYRCGVGATAPKDMRIEQTKSHGPLQVPLGFVPNQTPAVLWIDPHNWGTEYETLTALGQRSAHIPACRAPTRLMYRTGIHADGPDGVQDVAPVPISLRTITF